MYEEKSIRETCAQFSSNTESGLTEKEVIRRYHISGKNELKAPKKKTIIEAFLEQLNDPLIYVLLVAASISIVLREVSDAVIIIAVVVMNAVIGLIQEGKAQKALESLKKLTSPRACVIREGRMKEIPASKLVTGDIVCLETGGQIPADLRLIQTYNMKVEESAFTGESQPVEKEAGCIILPKKTRKGDNLEIPIGDRRNMAYMSTIVTAGRGRGIVTATGMDTEIGKIATFFR